MGLLLIAVLGLMAFGAVSAQATSFRILGSTSYGSETFTSRIDTLGILLDAIDNVDIDCLSFDVIEGVIKPSESKLRVLLLECSAREHKAPNAVLPNCKPKGGDISLEARSLPIGGATGNIVLTEPAAGKTNFMEFNFEGTCAIPNGALVKGATLFELLTEAGSSNGQQLAIPLKSTEEEILKGEDIIKLGTKQIEIDGSVFIELNGPNKSCKWGIG